MDDVIRYLVMCSMVIFETGVVSAGIRSARAFAFQKKIPSSPESHQATAPISIRSRSNSPNTQIAQKWPTHPEVHQEVAAEIAVDGEDLAEEETAEDVEVLVIVGDVVVAEVSRHILLSVDRRKALSIASRNCL